MRPVLLGVVFLLGARAAADPPPRPDRLGDPLPPRALARLGTARFVADPAPVYLTFSADGKSLACCNATALTTWDAETGRRLHAAQPGAGVTYVYWPAGGRGIAITGERHYEPYLWEYTNPKDAPPTAAVRPNDPREGRIACVAVSPDGKWAAAAWKTEAPERRVIEVYPLVPGKRLNQLTPLRVLGPFAEGCEEVVVTADSKRVVVLHSDWLARTYDAASGNELGVPTKLPTPGMNPNRYAFAVSPDGRFVAVAPRKLDPSQGSYEGDGTIRVMDLTTGKEARSFPHPSAQLIGLAFAPDSRHLVSSDRVAAFQVRDVVSGEEVSRSKEGGPTREAAAVAVSPDGKRFATARQDGHIDLWEFPTGKPVAAVESHRDSILGVAVSPDGKLAATIAADETLRVWETADGKPVCVIPAAVNRFSHPTSREVALCFTPDGRSIVFPGTKGLRLADARTGDPRRLPGDLADESGDPAGFAADGKTFLTRGETEVALWDWASGRERVAIAPVSAKAADQVGGMLAFVSAALSPDGRFVFTSSARWRPELNGRRGVHFAFNGNEVWDAATGKFLRRLDGPQPWYAAGRFSPDGSTLFVRGAGDVPTGAWDPRSGKLLRPFEVAQPDDLRYVNVQSNGPFALSPDGRLLAVSEPLGGDIRLHEVASGRVVGTLHGHSGVANGLVFTPDGRLVSGSADHTGLVWDVSLASFAAGPARALGPKELAAAWAQVASPDGAAAWRAMAELARSPSTAVPFVAANLKPVPTPTEADLDRLVKALDDPGFAEREAASAELDGYGPNAVAGVRDRLKAGPSPEAARRMERFLARHGGPHPSPAVLRGPRGVAVLEAVGSAEAVKVLEKLARDHPADPVGAEAAAALARLPKARRGE